MSADLPNTAAMFAPGSRVGKYLLAEQIGHGGMAAVFKAHDELLGRVVALKVLAPGLAADEAFRQRFIRESRAAAAVDDPHIIPLFDAGDADGVLFIAMRLVPGGDVRSLLFREGPLPADRVAAIVSPVASALDSAHASGLVHRDVKPANMLLDARPGRPDHVYLSDFGLSKGAAGSVGLTGTGLFLGTVDYAAPEQIDGGQVDGRSDQYALACAAFEMLTGEPPFRRDQGLAVLAAHLSQPPPRASARRGGLPSGVDAVLLRALAKSPSERYQRCGQFSDALREALGVGRYDAGSPGQLPRTGLPQATLGPADGTVIDTAYGAPDWSADSSEIGTSEGSENGTPEGSENGAPAGSQDDSGNGAADGAADWSAGSDADQTRAATAVHPGPSDPGSRALPPDPARRDNRGRDRSRAVRWLAAVAVVAVAATVAAVTFVLMTRPGNSRTASGPPTGPPIAAHPATGTASASSRPTATPSPARTPGPTPTQSPLPSPRLTPTPSLTPTPASAAASWASYRDPVGFSISLPPGWMTSYRSSDEVQFTGTPAGFVVVVAWTTQPRPDALTDWQQQAASKAAADPTYRQIRIRRVTYRGYNAADWEFTNRYQGQPIRVIDRGFIVLPGQLGYAIELYGPAAQWPSVFGSMWHGLVTSFRPPS